MYKHVHIPYSTSMPDLFDDARRNQMPPSKLNMTPEAPPLITTTTTAAGGLQQVDHSSMDPALYKNGTKDKTISLHIPADLSNHSRQPSDSGYSLIDYYADSPEPGSLAGPNNQTGISLQDEEPFTLITKNPVELASSSTSTLQNQQRRVTITRTESYASLKRSRTSAEVIRNKIDLSINSTTQGRKDRVASTSSTASSFSSKPAKKRSSILNSDRDRYGFKKQNHYINAKDYNNWWSEYSMYLGRRKKKWEKLMMKNGFQISKEAAPTRFPARSEDLKRYVRKGIPAEWRGNAWFYYARGYDKLKDNKGVYDRLVEETMDMINENTEAIEKDLHRTFPENVHFNNIKKFRETGESYEEESPLLQTLRRVLKCFSKYKPSIGYCQSLNFIAGLLLIFMDEEKAFWMLVIITERYLPGIHDFNLEGVNIHQGVLMLCVRQYLPEIWPYINENDERRSSNLSSRLTKSDNSFLYDLPPLSFCTTSWFMSIFVGVLPIETTLRVWDCLFYEDSKCIFQVSLTIFKQVEAQILELTSESSRITEDDGFLSAELFQIIQNSPKRALNANKLMEDCYKFSNFSKLTQEEIVNCKRYVVESRSRYNELIKRRSAVGLNENDRKELVKGAIVLENKKTGLKSLNWNSKLNTRMRRIQHKLR